jgi:hypothetical protein
MLEETLNVAEEIQQDVVQPNEAPQPEAQAQQEESDKDYNFRQLRESKKQLEERVARMERELEDARSQKVKAQEEDDDLGISDEDLAEGKHLRKLNKEIRGLKQALLQKEIQDIPHRLQAKYNDFEQVVTKENVEKLKQAEPELYASVISGSDLYAKGVAAYKTLKMLGIADPYTSEKEKIQRNLSKPGSVSNSSNRSAIHDANAFANGLTPDLRKQLLNEMQQAVKAR